MRIHVDLFPVFHPFLLNFGRCSSQATYHANTPWCITRKMAHWRKRKAAPLTDAGKEEWGGASLNLRGSNCIGLDDKVSYCRHNNFVLDLSLKQLTWGVIEIHMAYQLHSFQISFLFQLLSLLYIVSIIYSRISFKFQSLEACGCLLSFLLYFNWLANTRLGSAREIGTSFGYLSFYLPHPLLPPT